MLREKVGGTETDDNGNAMSQSFLSKLFKKKMAEDSFVPPLWGKRKKKKCSFFNYYLLTRLHAAEFVLVENCQHAHQKQVTRRQAFDLDLEPTHRQPASCWARLLNVDDYLEDAGWIRGLEGEKLPTASYALPSLKKKLFFAERDRDFLSPVFYTVCSAQMRLYQMPGQRPPCITGRFVHTVT